MGVEPPSWAGQKVRGQILACQMHVMVCGDLDVVHCVGASLLLAHCRLFACCCDCRSYFCSSAKGIWSLVCICWRSRAECCMRPGLMMRSLHQRHRFLRRRRRCSRRARCLRHLRGLCSPPDTVWYDSDVEDVHCVSGDATSNWKSRDLSSLPSMRTAWIDTTSKLRQCSCQRAVTILQFGLRLPGSAPPSRIRKCLAGLPTITDRHAC